MNRATPWLLLLVCAAVGGGLWMYRARHTSAEPVSVSPSFQPRPAMEEVRNAWTKGRHVALRGRQQIRMPGPHGMISVDADVLASDDGRVRINYLTAPLKNVTVWEDGERTYRFNPRLKRLSVSIQRKGADGADPQLLENYDAEAVDEEPVAGRKALVVKLRPRSGGGNSKRLWIDEERWVILRSEDRDPADRVARTSAFTHIEYLPAGQQPGPAEFKPSEEQLARYGDAIPGDSSSRFEPEALGKILGFAIRQPAWLPSGYRFDGAYQTASFCGGPGQGARLEYSDGLNALTVFLCGSPSCPDGSKAAHASQTASYLKVGDVHYLAVGELPKADLRRVLGSVPAR